MNEKVVFRISPWTKVIENEFSIILFLEKDKNILLKLKSIVSLKVELYTPFLY